MGSLVDIRWMQSCSLGMFRALLRAVSGDVGKAIQVCNIVSLLCKWLADEVDEHSSHKAIALCVPIVVWNGAILQQSSLRRGNLACLPAKICPSRPPRVGRGDKSRPPFDCFVFPTFVNITNEVTAGGQLGR